MPTVRTPQKIPARYTGAAGMRLSKTLGPYFDANGQRITNHFLEPGDTLMLPDTEVLGQSYLFDPQGKREPLWLGVGRVALPEDKDKDERALAILGYEFHTGRTDFEPLLPVPLAASAAESTGETQESSGTPMTFSRSEQGAQ